MCKLSLCSIHRIKILWNFPTSYILIIIIPLCFNADPFFFCGWSSNVEWTSNRSKASPGRCLFSSPPPSQDCSFPLGLGRESFCVGILKGRYINFDGFIDWFQEALYKCLQWMNEGGQCKACIKMKCTDLLMKSIAWAFNCSALCKSARTNTSDTLSTVRLVQSVSSHITFNRSRAYCNREHKNNKVNFISS